MVVGKALISQSFARFISISHMPVTQPSLQLAEVSLHFTVFSLPVDLFTVPSLHDGAPNPFRGRRNVCYGIMSSEEQLGGWGLSPSRIVPLQLKRSPFTPLTQDALDVGLDSGEEQRGSVDAWQGHATVLHPAPPHEPHFLDYRIVVVACEDAACTRPVEIVGVDNRFSLPTRADVLYQTEARGNIVIDVAQGEEGCQPLHFVPISNGFRCCVGNRSPLLALTFYNFNARRGFVQQDWQRSIDRRLLERINHAAAKAQSSRHCDPCGESTPSSAVSSLYDVVDLKMKRCEGVDWVRQPWYNKYIKRRKTRSTGTTNPLSSATSVPSPQSHDSLATGHSHESLDGNAELHDERNDEALFEPLAVAQPLCVTPEEAQCGVRSHVTGTFWKATLDLSKCQGWIPVLVIQPKYVPDAMTAGGCIEVALHPDMFGAHSNGNFVLPIQLHGWFTTLHVQYVEVTPFLHAANHFERIRSMEAMDHLTLDTMVGHRGLGKTYTSSDSSAMKQKLAENSLESLNAAHARGCQCVEFDVMLTKDYVPIIFHDAVLQVDARGKQVESKHGNQLLGKYHQQQQVTLYDAVPVAIHQLTHRQLCGTVTKAYQEERQSKLRELLAKHWVSILHLSADSELKPAHTAASQSTPTEQSTPTLPPGDAPRTPLMSSRQRTLSAFRPTPRESINTAKHHRFITNHIPTLQELFEQTPSTLRLDLEVKFPFQPIADSHLYLQTDHFEVNEFVNAILDVVFYYSEKQPEREIVFCSFEPDVCVALMLKQTRFHVLFLSDTEEHVDLKDYRSFEVEVAMQFAHAHRLAGISIYSITLMMEDEKKLIPAASDLKNWTKQIGRLAGPRVPSLSDLSLLADQAMVERWSTVSTKRGFHLVECAHRHNLKVWTWGDRNSDPHFAFLQAQEMHVDAVISDNVPLWSNASVGRKFCAQNGGSRGGSNRASGSSTPMRSSKEASPQRSRTESAVDLAPPAE